MKYTRYDIKRNNKKNIFSGVVIASVLLLAFLAGTAIFNLGIKNRVFQNGSGLSKNQPASSSQTNDNIQDSKYVLIQFGAFQNKENAKNLQSSLTQSYGDTYLIEDGNSNRVISGIYTESASTGILKSLAEKNIVNSKMTISIKESDLCNKEIIEMINANLLFFNKLSDKSIKSIQTDDLKKWTNSLKDIDKNSSNFKVLEDLKKHTEALPTDETKDNNQENYTYIYSILKQFK